MTVNSSPIPSSLRTRRSYRLMSGHTPANPSFGGVGGMSSGTTAAPFHGCSDTGASFIRQSPPNNPATCVPCSSFGTWSRIASASFRYVWLCGSLRSGASIDQFNSLPLSNDRRMSPRLFAICFLVCAGSFSNSASSSVMIRRISVKSYEAMTRVWFFQVLPSSLTNG